MIRIRCPVCAADLRYLDKIAGKLMECPDCRVPLRVPTESEAFEPDPDTPRPKRVPRIVVTCPSCGEELQVSSRDRGRQVECPHCNDVVRIPRAQVAIEARAAKTLTNKHTLGWWASACGIVGLVLCAPVGICAIVLGVLSFQREPNPSGAIGGIVMGAISVFWWVGVTLLWLLAVSSH